MSSGCRRCRLWMKRDTDDRSISWLVKSIKMSKQINPLIRAPDIHEANEGWRKSTFGVHKWSPTWDNNEFADSPATFRQSKTRRAGSSYSENLQIRFSFSFPSLFIHNAIKNAGDDEEQWYSITLPETVSAHTGTYGTIWAWGHTNEWLHWYRTVATKAVRSR